MKPNPFAPLVAGLALITSAQAGTPAIEVAPIPVTNLWHWFVGGSAGYLADQEEAMYGLQFGVETGTAVDRRTHALYLQVGFTQDDAGFRSFPPPGTVGGRTEAANIDLNLVPITLNYKFQACLTGRLDYYLGVGVGIAVVDSSSNWRWTQAVAPPNNQGGGSYDQTDVRFYADIFAGLSYGFSDAFEMFAGARYILMDDVNRNINITGASYYEAGIDGDVLIELGARYHF